MSLMFLKKSSIISNQLLCKKLYAGGSIGLYACTYIYNKERGLICICTKRLYTLLFSLTLVAISLMLPRNILKRQNPTTYTYDDTAQIEQALNNDITDMTEPEHEPESYETETSQEPPDYTDDELDLLARIIYAEAGGMSDECQLLVGNVVLNRVADDRFPDSIYGVIYQKGQYSPTWNGAIHKKPSDRAVENAKRLQSGERCCPAEVVWQSEFRQGNGVYKKITENGTTMWFCY